MFLLGLFGDREFAACTTSRTLVSGFRLSLYPPFLDYVLLKRTELIWICCAIHCCPLRVSLLLLHEHTLAKKFTNSIFVPSDLRRYTARKSLQAVVAFPVP